jgi:hypothetical protein
MCDPQFQIMPLSGVAAISASRLLCRGATQFSPDRKARVTERRAAIPLAPPHPRKHFVSTPHAPIDGWPTLRDIGENWMFSGRSSPCVACLALSIRKFPISNVRSAISGHTSQRCSRDFCVPTPLSGRDTTYLGHRTARSDSACAASPAQALPFHSACAN